jgi:hypothetical protein
MPRLALAHDGLRLQPVRGLDERLERPSDRAGFVTDRRPFGIEGARLRPALGRFEEDREAGEPGRVPGPALCSSGAITVW